MCTKFLLEASNDLLLDVSATERSVLGVSEFGCVRYIEVFHESLTVISSVPEETAHYREVSAIRRFHCRQFHKSSCKDW